MPRGDYVFEMECESVNVPEFQTSGWKRNCSGLFFAFKCGLGLVWWNRFKDYVFSGSSVVECSFKVVIFLHPPQPLHLPVSVNGGSVVISRCMSENNLQKYPKSCEVMIDIMGRTKKYNLQTEQSIFKIRHSWQVESN